MHWMPDTSNFVRDCKSATYSAGGTLANNSIVAPSSCRILAMSPSTPWSAS